METDASKARSRELAPQLLVSGKLLLVLCFGCVGCAGKRTHLAIHEVSPGIFIGPKPWTAADFDTLRAHHIKTILNLEDWPWDVWPEAWQAHRRRIEHRHVCLLAAPLPPSEKHVNEALSILDDASLRPIFVHCFLGEDRANLVVGLYRVYFEGWTPRAAWDDMRNSGFHSGFVLHGLSSYFWHHTAKPEWVRARPPPG